MTDPADAQRFPARGAPVAADPADPARGAPVAADPADPLRLTTRVAQMGDEDHIYRGHAIFGELLGRESITGLLALSAGLPRLPPEDVALLDDLAVVNALCDARIWPVKLTRLVASYGGALQGLCAGNLMHDNGIIGAGPCRRGAELLVELMAALGGPAGLDDLEAAPGGPERLGAAVEDILRRERWPGFGVPFRDVDERMVALRRRLRETGRDRRPHVRLLLLVEAYLTRARRLGVNIIGGVYAAMLDIGLRPEQCAWMLVVIVQSNFSAPAFEGAQARAAALQELPADRIAYAGPAPRTSPRAGRR